MGWSAKSSWKIYYLKEFQAFLMGCSPPECSVRKADPLADRPSAPRSWEPGQRGWGLQAVLVLGAKWPIVSSSMEEKVRMNHAGLSKKLVR